LYENNTAEAMWVYTLNNSNITYAYPLPSPNSPGGPLPIPTENFPANGY